MVSPVLADLGLVLICIILELYSQVTVTLKLNYVQLKAMSTLVMAMLKGLAKMAQPDVDCPLQRLTSVLVLDAQSFIHLPIFLETAINLHLSLPFWDHLSIFQCQF